MTFLNNFEGIIFDLDGVLVDTEYFQWQGWIEVLKPYGIVFKNEDKYLYTGKNVTIIARELIKKYKISLTIEELSEKKEDIINAWLKTKEILLMKHAKESVEYFKNIGLKIAVCTSGSSKETQIKLEKVGLFNEFDSISCRNDVKRGKPFPDLYLNAAKKLNLKPSKCLAFEDTQYGVESAKSAGLYCIAIPNEFSAKQDFSKADKIFSNLEEAVNWIKG